ncbi:glycosyltransferase family 2 protein [Larkinella punicea]|uniref:Glycosyltransferase family 2 protein n=1 Tax=Larkinella punicea TaxID=2315727 RepID=A0A368JKP1_9BACT|nr:glycosyltransferase family A protein [Larkinella punicea]RCR67616.1 glycosyltransferase family 2 protein [Larkinella punicea]
MYSIVIPLYNKEEYISQCISSILQQTFTEFELIIVNDGSTDNSLSVAMQFNDPRIFIINQSNKGVSVARNNGVMAAKFDYIAFLDADDWWSIHFLEHIFFLIQDFPEASIFGTQYFWVKNNHFTISLNHERKGFRGYIDYFSAYTYAWWMPLSCISVVLLKRTFHQLGGFNTNLKFGEDFDLWIRYAIQYKIAYLNEPLAFYNQDVELPNRAIGNYFLQPPESHFIFNIPYLNAMEHKSASLKRLLDGLRVRSLLPYYISGQYAYEVKSILDKVEFKQQPFFYHFIYRSPLFFVKLYFKIKKVASSLKQAICQLLRR